MPSSTENISRCQFVSAGLQWYTLSAKSH